MGWPGGAGLHDEEGDVKIYFGNLPERSTVRDLLLFIYSNQRHRVVSLLLNEDVEIISCEIVRTVDECGKIACYGVAHVFPRKRALKLITRLYGRQFRGRDILVREYFDRIQVRDRRGSGWELQNVGVGFEKRTRERRNVIRLDDWDG